MKAARLVVLGVAIAAGGLAAMMAGKGRKPDAPPPPMPALETVDVLVAKLDLQRGQLIEPPQIGWQAWPKAAANAHFITRAARPNAQTQFVNAIVRVPIAAGQPIYDPMVVFAKGSGFLAAILPKGMRAIAMDVSPDSAAGGFILPEDHVDVLLTRHDKAAEKGSGGVEKIISDTILRNIRVLAVDQAVEEKSGTKVAVAKTVTLQVAPAQAEVLAVSRMQGTLALALRSLTDSQNAPDDESERTNVSAAINTVRFGVSAMTTVSR